MSTIPQRIAAIEAELTALKIEFGKGWKCACCGQFCPPNWFSYQVRLEESDIPISPACATCARKMYSEGPFPSPSL